MAFKHGKTAAVAWNQYDVTGYLRSAELSLGVEAADTSVFGLGWTTALPGLAESSFSAEGLYDPTTQAYWRDQLAVSSGVLTYAPSGWANTGDPVRMLFGASTAYGESSPVGDVVAFSWEVMSEGPFASGVVINQFDRHVNSGSGVGVDGGASTSTGWTAHLHVFSVDAGSWAISLADSADGNTYAAVSDSSFTAVTTATSQRLRSATSTAVLRRYVRYAATRTGGTAGDGLTFGLVVARTY